MLCYKSFKIFFSFTLGPGNIYYVQVTPMLLRNFRSPFTAEFNAALCPGFQGYFISSSRHRTHNVMGTISTRGNETAFTVASLSPCASKSFPMINKEFSLEPIIYLYTTTGDYQIDIHCSVVYIFFLQNYISINKLNFHIL